MSYLGRLLVEGAYTSAEKQSVYSTAPADWAILHSCYLVVSHWRLSDSKFPRVPRILLSILGDLNNPAVLDGLNSSSNYPFLQSFYHFKRTTIFDITVTYKFQLLLSSSSSLLLLLLFYFLRAFYICVFHQSLSDSKSLQVSRTLLSIMADLNSSIV